MLGTVGIASAAPTDNFSITTLTLDNAYSVDGVTDDNSPIAISSTHVLWNSENGIEAYAIADLSGATLTGVDEATGQWMFTNIKTATAHYFVQTEGDGNVHTITGIGTLNNDGTTSSVPVIDLSEDLVLEETNADYGRCKHLGSGFGHVVIWDVCDGTMWNIDLPSGTVTVTEGVNVESDFGFRPFGDKNEGADLFNSWGVVEHVNGQYAMVEVRRDDGLGLVAIARFPINDPNGTHEDLLALTGSPDMGILAVNVDAGIWCTHTENGWADVGSDDGMGEPTTCMDASFNVQSLLPSTGANSMLLVVTGLLLVAGGALALVRRPRIA